MSTTFFSTYPGRPGNRCLAKVYRCLTPVALVLASASLLGAQAKSSASGSHGLERSKVKEVEVKMGSRFELSAVHADEPVARRAIAAAWREIDRLEAMISSWRESSETSLVNRHAGEGPVVVSPELYGLIDRTLKVSKLTEGAFDITFASFGDLWDFKASAPQLPRQEDIDARLAAVGYEDIALDPSAHSVFLRKPGARIGFGAIGKGFAANRAARVMAEHGVVGGVVNAGGDLYAFGTQADGSPWRIGIADPLDRDTVFAHVALSNQAVVTSGDYESYVEIDGERYAHILDPRTGWPVKELRSVTVLCPDAELADALATSVFVLGPIEGLRLVDRLRDVEALLVTSEGQLLFSRNLESMLSGAGEES